MNINKIISITLVAAFLAQDIAWAYPDKLQVQLRTSTQDFKAAYDAEYQIEEAAKIAEKIDLSKPSSLEDVSRIANLQNIQFDPTMKFGFFGKAVFSNIHIPVSKDLAIHYSASESDKIPPGYVVLLSKEYNSIKLFRRILVSGDLYAKIHSQKSVIKPAEAAQAVNSTGHEVTVTGTALTAGQNDLLNKALGNCIRKDVDGELKYRPGSPAYSILDPDNELAELEAVPGVQKGADLYVVSDWTLREELAKELIGIDPIMAKEMIDEIMYILISHSGTWHGRAQNVFILHSRAGQLKKMGELYRKQWAHHEAEHIRSPREPESVIQARAPINSLLARLKSQTEIDAAIKEATHMILLKDLGGFRLLKDVFMREDTGTVSRREIIELLLSHVHPPMKGAAETEQTVLNRGEAIRAMTGMLAIEEMMTDDLRDRYMVILRTIHEFERNFRHGEIKGDYNRRLRGELIKIAANAVRKNSTLREFLIEYGKHNASCKRLSDLLLGGYNNWRRFSGVKAILPVLKNVDFIIKLGIGVALIYTAYSMPTMLTKAIVFGTGVLGVVWGMHEAIFSKAVLYNYHFRLDSIVRTYEKSIIYGDENFPIRSDELRPVPRIVDEESTAPEAQRYSKIAKAISIMTGLSGFYGDDGVLLQRVESLEKKTTIICLNDMKKYLFFGDTRYGTYKPAHIGRRRNVIYLSARFIDSLHLEHDEDMRCLASVLNQAQRFIDRYNALVAEEAASGIQNPARMHSELQKETRFLTAPYEYKICRPEKLFARLRRMAEEDRKIDKEIAKDARVKEREARQREKGLKEKWNGPLVGPDNRTEFEKDYFELANMYSQIGSMWEGISHVFRYRAMVFYREKVRIMEKIQDDIFACANGAIQKKYAEHNWIKIQEQKVYFLLHQGMYSEFLRELDALLSNKSGVENFDDVKREVSYLLTLHKAVAWPFIRLYVGSVQKSVERMLREYETRTRPAGSAVSTEVGSGRDGLGAGGLPNSRLPEKYRSGINPLNKFTTLMTVVAAGALLVFPVFLEAAVSAVSNTNVVTQAVQNPGYYSTFGFISIMVATLIGFVVWEILFCAVFTMNKAKEFVKRIESEGRIPLRGGQEFSMPVSWKWLLICPVYYTHEISHYLMGLAMGKRHNRLILQIATNNKKVRDIEFAIYSAGNLWGNDIKELKGLYWPYMIGPISDALFAVSSFIVGLFIPHLSPYMISISIWYAFHFCLNIFVDGCDFKHAQMYKEQMRQMRELEEADALDDDAGVGSALLAADGAGEALDDLQSMANGGAIAKGSLETTINGIKTMADLKRLVPEVTMSTDIPSKITRARQKLSHRISGFTRHGFPQSVERRDWEWIQEVGRILNPDLQFYYFNSKIYGAEDYLLGFGKNIAGKKVIGIAADLVEKLPVELIEEYIFHEIMETIRPDNFREVPRLDYGDEHYKLYRGIQRRFFGSKNPLKDELREYIFNKMMKAIEPGSGEKDAYPIILSFQDAQRKLDDGIRVLKEYSGILNPAGLKVLKRAEECRRTFDPALAEKIISLIPTVEEPRTELFIDVELPEKIFLDRGYVGLQINNGCNEPCAFCCVNGNGKRNSMPYPLLVKLADKIYRKTGADSICLYEDSDPMLYHDKVLGADIADVYEKLYPQYVNIQIVTNGWAADDEAANRAAEKLVPFVYSRLTGEALNDRHHKVRISYHFFYSDLIDAISRGDEAKISKIYEREKSKYKNVIRRLSPKGYENCAQLRIDNKHSEKWVTESKGTTILKRCEELQDKALKEIQQELHDENGININDSEIGPVKEVQWQIGRRGMILRKLDITKEQLPVVSRESLVCGNNTPYHVFRPDGKLDVLADMPLTVGQCADGALDKGFIAMLLKIKYLNATGMIKLRQYGNIFDEVRRIHCDGGWEFFVTRILPEKYPQLFSAVEELDFKNLQLAELKRVYGLFKDLKMPYPELRIKDGYDLTFKTREGAGCVYVDISIEKTDKRATDEKPLGGFDPYAANPLDFDDALGFLPDLTGRWYAPTAAIFDAPTELPKGNGAGSGSVSYAEFPKFAAAAGNITRASGNMKPPGSPFVAPGPGDREKRYARDGQTIGRRVTGGQTPVVDDAVAPAAADGAARNGSSPQSIDSTFFVPDSASSIELRRAIRHDIVNWNVSIYALSLFSEGKSPQWIAAKDKLFEQCGKLIRVLDDSSDADRWVGSFRLALQEFNGQTTDELISTLYNELLKDARPSSLLFKNVIEGLKLFYSSFFSEDQITKIDLRKMIEVASGFAIYIPDHYSIDIQIGEGSESIYARPGQLFRILVNLIHNSEEALERVRGDLHGEEIFSFSGHIHINSHLDKSGEVIIEEWGDGPGMTDDQIAKFYSHETFSSKPGGGRGLRSIRELAERNGGSFDIRNEQGRGTVFTITLPAHVAANGAGNATENVGTGASTESGTVGSSERYQAQAHIDTQLEEYYSDLAASSRLNRNAGDKIRDLKKEPLSSKEVLTALKSTGKLTELGVTEDQLQEIITYIHEQAGIPDEIEILFAIPKGNRKLWWIRDPKTKKPLYAGGHFNQRGTRIHISLPMILDQELTGVPAREAALAVARHDYAHIRSILNKNPKLSLQHDEHDEGFSLVRRVAEKEEILISQKKRRIDRLCRQYLPRYRGVAEREYFLTKYFVEKFAGVPFTQFDKDEFWRETRQIAIEGFQRLEGSDNFSVDLRRYVMNHLSRKLALLWGCHMSDVHCVFQKIRAMVYAYESNGAAVPLCVDKKDLVSGFLGDRYAEEKLRIVIKAVRESETNSLAARQVATSGIQTEHLMREEAMTLLKEAIESLKSPGGSSYRLRQIIKLSYGLYDGHEYTSTEISRIFKLSRSRIEQLISNGGRWLVEHKRLLKDYTRGGDYSPVTDSRNMPILADRQPVRRIWSGIDLSGTSESGQNGRNELNEEHTRELIDWVDDNLTDIQKRMLPHVLLHKNCEEITEELGLTKNAQFEMQYHTLVKKLRCWFTFGMFAQFGPVDEVTKTLITTFSKSKLERLFDDIEFGYLAEHLGGDTETLEELIKGSFPEFSVREIRQLIASHFKEIAMCVERKSSGSFEARKIASVAQRMMMLAKTITVEKKKLVVRRLLRNIFYPSMRRDEETGSSQRLEAIGNEIEFIRDPLIKEGFRQTYEYYDNARSFHPRGFREVTPEGRKEPLIPAQRYAVWQALGPLQSPEHGVLLTSESRIGKTIMAGLAAFNIKKTSGEYAVKRLLYTTTNQAKYEVADELRRRLSQELDLRVFVIDPKMGSSEDQINTATQEADQGKNVAIIINYEAYDPKNGLLEHIRNFRPDAHVIDEIENLRHTKGRVRAPEIFAIPAEYRIGISARLLLKSTSDLVEPLLWVRSQSFPYGDRGRAVIEKLSSDSLYKAIDPVMVGWRRRIVLPEIGDPEYVNEYIPYSPEQDRTIHAIRSNYSRWLKEDARPDKRNQSDHIFRRIDMEQRAGVNLAMVLPKNEHSFTESAPKIQRLNQIIDAEKNKNGKVVVIVDFVEEVDRLVKYYSKRLGPGAAIGISSDDSLSNRNDGIWRFRTEREPTILIGTSYLLGSSLNLFQVPGSSFHISTLVRLSRPWWNVNDGERLIGIGQDHPVKVITLISTFSAGSASSGIETTVDQMLDSLLREENSRFRQMIHADDPDAYYDEELKKHAASLLSNEPAGGASTSVTPEKYLRGINPLDGMLMQPMPPLRGRGPIDTATQFGFATVFGPGQRAFFAKKYATSGTLPGRVDVSRDSAAADGASSATESAGTGASTESGTVGSSERHQAQAHNDKLLTESEIKALTTEDVVRILKNPPSYIKNSVNQGEWRRKGWRAFTRKASLLFKGWKKAIVAAGLIPISDVKPREKEYVDWSAVRSIIPNDFFRGNKIVGIWYGLNREQKRLLWEEVRKHNGAAREAIILLNERLVINYVDRLLLGHEDLKSYRDDLIQCGMYGPSHATTVRGLAKAVDAFDPDRGLELSTLARIAIRQSLNMEIRRIRRRPEHNALLIGQPVEYKGRETPLDVVDPRGQIPVNAVIAEEMLDRIRTKLNDKEKTALDMMLSGATHREISEAVGMSRQWVGNTFIRKIEKMVRAMGIMAKPSITRTTQQVPMVPANEVTSTASAASQSEPGRPHYNVTTIPGFTTDEPRYVAEHPFMPTPKGHPSPRAKDGVPGSGGRIEDEAGSAAPAAADGAEEAVAKIRLKSKALSDDDTVAVEVHNHEDYGGDLKALEGMGIGLTQKIILMYRQIAGNEIQILEDGTVLLHSNGGEFQISSYDDFLKYTDMTVALFPEKIPKNVILVGNFYRGCHFVAFQEIVRRFLKVKGEKIAFHFVTDMIKMSPDVQLSDYLKDRGDLVTNARNNAYYNFLNEHGLRAAIYVDGENITPDIEDPQVILHYWTDMKDGKAEKLRNNIAYSSGSGSNRQPLVNAASLKAQGPPLDADMPAQLSRTRRPPINPTRLDPGNLTGVPGLKNLHYMTDGPAAADTIPATVKTPRGTFSEEKIIEMLKNPPPGVKNIYSPSAWLSVYGSGFITAIYRKLGPVVEALKTHCPPSAQGFREAEKKLADERRKKELIALLSNPPQEVTEIGDPRNMSNWNKANRHHDVRAVERCFGSWREGLIQAGINPMTPKPKPWEAKLTDWSAVKSIIPDLVQGDSGIVNDPRLLTAAEEKALGVEVQRGNVAAREALVKTNIRLVKYLVGIFMKKFHLHNDPILTFEDLVTVGISGYREGKISVGLTRGAELFDPNHGRRFATFAGWHIKHAIGYYIRQTLKTRRSERVAMYPLEEGAKPIAPTRVKDKKSTDPVIEYLKALDGDELEALRFKVSPYVGDRDWQILLLKLQGLNAREIGAKPQFNLTNASISQILGKTIGCIRRALRREEMGERNGYAPKAAFAAPQIERGSPHYNAKVPDFSINPGDVDEFSRATLIGNSLFDGIVDRNKRFAKHTDLGDGGRINPTAQAADGVASVTENVGTGASTGSGTVGSSERHQVQTQEVSEKLRQLPGRMARIKYLCSVVGLDLNEIKKILDVTTDELLSEDPWSSRALRRFVDRVDEETGLNIGVCQVVYGKTMKEKFRETAEGKDFEGCLMGAKDRLYFILYELGPAGVAELAEASKINRSSLIGMRKRFKKGGSVVFHDIVRDLINYIHVNLPKLRALEFDNFEFVTGLTALESLTKVCKDSTQRLRVLRYATLENISTLVRNENSFSSASIKWYEKMPVTRGELNKPKDMRAAKTLTGIVNMYSRMHGFTITVGLVLNGDSSAQSAEPVGADTDKVGSLEQAADKFKLLEARCEKAVSELNKYMGIFRDGRSNSIKAIGLYYAKMCIVSARRYLKEAKAAIYEANLAKAVGFEGDGVELTMEEWEDEAMARHEEVIVKTEEEISGASSVIVKLGKAIVEGGPVGSSTVDLYNIPPPDLSSIEGLLDDVMDIKAMDKAFRTLIHHIFGEAARIESFGIVNIAGKTAANTLLKNLAKLDMVVVSDENRRTISRCKERVMDVLDDAVNSAIANGKEDSECFSEKYFELLSSLVDVLERYGAPLDEIAKYRESIENMKTVEPVKKVKKPHGWAFRHGRGTIKRVRTSKAAEITPVEIPMPAVAGWEPSMPQMARLKEQVIPVATAPTAALTAVPDKTTELSEVVPKVASIVSDIHAQIESVAVPIERALSLIEQDIRDEELTKALRAAEEGLDKAYNKLEKAVDRDPGLEGLKKEAAYIIEQYVNLSRAFRKMHDFAKAEAMLNEAYKIFQKYSPVKEVEARIGCIVEGYTKLVLSSINLAEFSYKNVESIHKIEATLVAAEERLNRITDIFIETLRDYPKDATLMREAGYFISCSAKLASRYIYFGCYLIREEKDFDKAGKILKKAGDRLKKTSGLLGICPSNKHMTEGVIPYVLGQHEYLVVNYLYLVRDFRDRDGLSGLLKLSEEVLTDACAIISQYPGARNIEGRARHIVRRLYPIFMEVNIVVKNPAEKREHLELIDEIATGLSRVPGVGAAKRTRFLKGLLADSIDGLPRQMQSAVATTGEVDSGASRLIEEAARFASNGHFDKAEERLEGVCTTLESKKIDPERDTNDVSAILQACLDIYIALIRDGTEKTPQKYTHFARVKGIMDRTLLSIAGSGNELYSQAQAVVNDIDARLKLHRQGGVQRGSVSRGFAKLRSEEPPLADMSVRLSRERRPSIDSAQIDPDNLTLVPGQKNLHYMSDGPAAADGAVGNVPIELPKVGEVVIDPSILQFKDETTEIIIAKAMAAIRAQIGRGVKTPWLHYDIIKLNDDGTTTAIVNNPKAEITIDKLKPEILSAIKSSASMAGLPVNIDVHIMAMEPSEENIGSYIKNGADVITLHWEGFSDKNLLTQRLRFIKGQFRLAGLAFNPDADMDEVIRFVRERVEKNEIDLLLQMTVYPGSRGQPFSPETLGNLRRLRSEFPDITLQVDGGIEPVKWAAGAAKEGANILVAGSAFFGKGDGSQEEYEANLKGLQDSVRRGLSGDVPAPSKVELFNLFQTFIGEEQRIAPWGIHRRVKEIIPMPIMAIKSMGPRFVLEKDSDTLAYQICTSEGVLGPLEDGKNIYYTNYVAACNALLFKGKKNGRPVVGIFHFTEYSCIDEILKLLKTNEITEPVFVLTLSPGGAYSRKDELQISRELKQISSEFPDAKLFFYPHIPLSIFDIAVNGFGFGIFNARVEKKPKPGDIFMWEDLEKTPACTLCADQYIYTESRSSVQVADGAAVPAAPAAVPVRNRARGCISMEDKPYYDSLCGLLSDAIGAKRESVSDRKRRIYAELIANSLVRYDRESLDSLEARGMLSHGDNTAIAERKIFDVNALAGRALALLDSYKSKKITFANQQGLLENFFTVEEIEALESRYIPRGVPRAIIVLSCVRYFSDPTAFLERSLKLRDEILKEPEFIHISPSGILKACCNNPGDPRKRLRELMNESPGQANVRSNPAPVIRALDRLFKETNLSQTSRVLLSENLFKGAEGDMELEQMKIALQPLLNSGRVAILSPRDIRRESTNGREGRVDKTKLAIVLTKEDFGNRDLWNDTDKETSLKASVLVLDDRLTGGNYLYLEGVIGLAHAIMGNRQDAIRAYYKLLSGDPINESAMALLDDGRPNNSVFAAMAILRFKPITKVNGEEFNRYRIAMESALIAA